MPVTWLTHIKVENLRCYDEGDGPGPAEPYLWTIFFKVDGTTVDLKVDLEKGKVNLIGQASITALNANSNHSNLGVSESGVFADEIGITGKLKPVPIPETVGSWVSIVRPIPIILPQLPDGFSVAHIPDSIQGMVGFLAVLLEEDETTSTDVAAAHKIFNDHVHAWINENLSAISIDLALFLDGTDPSDLDLSEVLEQIDVNELVGSIRNSIEVIVVETLVPRILALVSAGFLLDPIFHLIAAAVANQDDFIGFIHDIIWESEVVGEEAPLWKEANARWNESTGAEDGDWELEVKTFASQYKISSLLFNLRYADADPQQGLRQKKVLPNGGSILQWISSLTTEPPLGYWSKTGYPASHGGLP